MEDFVAQAIFAAYFVLIAACFVLVFKSAFQGVSLGNAWTSGSYVFLRNALFALVCTWYCKCVP
jgi:alpha-1,2-mannosyltransferase